MTDDTAKILAEALTKLGRNVNAIGEQVKAQTENTELLLRLITAKGVEEAADIAKSLRLKKRQKMYDEMVTKLRTELKLDEKTEKPAEPVVETLPTHDE